MNIPTRTEKAIISRLKNKLFESALELTTSEFVNKDKNSAYNLIGEFLNHKAPLDVVSKLMDNYPELLLQKDNYDNCILYYIARNHRLDVLQNVQSRGVDIHRDINGYGSCLHVASRFDNSSFIKSLTLMGFDHNRLNNKGESPECISRRWGNYENISFFDSINENPNLIKLLRDKKSETTQEYLI
jgi:ankyrin repeat protein